MSPLSLPHNLRSPIASFQFPYSNFWWDGDEKADSPFGPTPPQPMTEYVVYEPATVTSITGEGKEGHSAGKSERVVAGGALNHEL